MHHQIKLKFDPKTTYREKIAVEQQAHIIASENMQHMDDRYNSTYQWYLNASIQTKIVNNNNNNRDPGLRPVACNTHKKLLIRLGIVPSDSALAIFDWDWDTKIKLLRGSWSSHLQRLHHAQRYFQAVPSISACRTEGD